MLCQRKHGAKPRGQDAAAGAAGASGPEIAMPVMARYGSGRRLALRAPMRPSRSWRKALKMGFGESAGEGGARRGLLGLEQRWGVFERLVKRFGLAAAALCELRFTAPFAADHGGERADELAGVVATQKIRAHGGH